MRPLPFGRLLPVPASFRSKAPVRFGFPGAVIAASTGLPRPWPVVPLLHPDYLPASDVCQYPISLRNARLDFSSSPLSLSLSGSRASFSLYFPVVARTAGPPPASHPPPHPVSPLHCLLVLAAAPLRLLPPRPPTCPPGSTPQAHVVGVGCRRIASAIQGGQGGAVCPVQERSGAAAGSRECSGRGPAPQQQRLVQRVLGEADRRFRGDPPGTTSRSCHATPLLGREARTIKGGGAIDAFARFHP